MTDEEGNNRMISNIDGGLYFKICDYEDEFFSDLTLNDFVDLCDLDTQTDVISLYSSNSWVFDIVPDDDPEMEGLGVCGYNPDKKDFFIKIVEQEKNNSIVILHEMIHAYIYILNDKDTVSNIFAKDLLGVHLYDRLYPKIQNLKYILYMNMNRDLFENGHNTLFLLKSLDLDIKLGLPLGSVFDYDRKDFIQALDEQIKSGGAKKINIEWDNYLPPAAK